MVRHNTDAEDMLASGILALIQHGLGTCQAEACLYKMATECCACALLQEQWRPGCSAADHMQ